MTAEIILNVLEDLTKKELDKFRWFLQQPDVVLGLPPVRAGQLKTTDTWDTVSVMVQTYTLPVAVEVTRKVLEKINRNDLVQSLSDSNSGSEGQSQIINK